MYTTLHLIKIILSNILLAVIVNNIIILISVCDLEVQSLMVAMHIHFEPSLCTSVADYFCNKLDYNVQLGYSEGFDSHKSLIKFICIFKNISVRITNLLFVFYTICLFICLELSLDKLFTEEASILIEQI